jgi:hypothetical protein
MPRLLDIDLSESCFTGKYSWFSYISKALKALKFFDHAIYQSYPARLPVFRVVDVGNAVAKIDGIPV